MLKGVFSLQANGDNTDDDDDDDDDDAVAVCERKGRIDLELKLLVKLLDKLYRQ